ncbi:hypothetical protein [Niveibacterium sp. SC-1]|uniref:hypothetical protein n=1 Tax=Niveibacterium sp. SC-1 TaxID=3135646 RepID=UPI00311EB70F
MKTICAALFLFAFASTASAGCYGTDAFKTCTDSSGNTYQVNKLGNTTTVNGYNAQTGSNWSQQSQQIGNTTITNGRAANGNAWNETTQNLGGGRTTTYGTDSSGRSYQRTCSQFGCF